MPVLLCPRLLRAESWIALIDLIRDREVTAGDGERGTLRGSQVCVALPRLERRAEAGDGDDTGDTQACDFFFFFLARIKITWKCTHTCSERGTPCSLLMVQITARVA